ncbi:MAG: iron complex outermembrane receptor protein [Marivirga sp.]|jgi:iron complex outermembrane receptor protein
MRQYFSALITLCFLSLSIHSTLGQMQSTSISGSLINDAGAPIPYSTIAWFKADSSLIKGAISDNAGDFSLVSDFSGTSYIVVQNIEFQTYTSPFLELEAGEQLVVAPISLSASTEALSEVVVSAKRQMVEVLPDRMVFNVSSSINASGNNGLELLSKAPGVVIDPDNNVILQGKSGVRIFINGRPSRLSGADLATLLESMQSDNIELIELITNPSAKYEAEGNAGIINIKLKNNVNLGYNGSIISSYSKGDSPRLSNGISFNYGKNKLGITANVTRFDNVFEEGFEDLKQQSGFGLSLKSIEKQNRNGYNVSTSLTYDLSDKHSFNLAVGGVVTNADDKLISNTYIANNANPEEDQILASQTLTNYLSNNYNYNLNYIWAINKKSSLTADVSYGSFNKDNRIEQPNTYFDATDNSPIREVNNTFDPYTAIDLYSAKVDYEYNFERFSLSTGAKYYQVITENEFVVSEVVGGVESINSEKSNVFNYTEEVAAIYAIVNAELVKDLKLSAGLRIENTNSLGVLESTQQTANDRVPRNYINYFPNISLAYKMGRSAFSIGYGNRIARPNYQDLNPFEAKTSELVIWKGNPFLNPNFITNYQFTYSWNDALVISNTYSITEGYFARILEIVDETSTFIVPQNMRKTTTNGLSISYPFQIAKWWDVSAFFVYNRSTFEGEFDNATIDITTDIFNVRMQSSITLPWDIAMSLSAYYSSPYIWRGSIELASYYGIEYGLRKDFFDNKLQVRLTGADIFNTSSDFGYEGDYGGIQILGVYSADNQRFGFGLTYKFGNNTIKNRSRKGGLEDQLDRISN